MPLLMVCIKKLRGDSRPSKRLGDILKQHPDRPGLVSRWLFQRGNFDSEIDLRITQTCGSMWVKQCQKKSPMTGNGSYHLYIYDGDWGMVYEIVLPTLVNWMMIECTLSILLVHNNSGDVPLAAYNLRQTSLIDDFQDHLLDAGSDGGSTITGWYVYGSTVWGPQGHKVSELATSQSRNAVLKSNRWWKPLLGHIYLYHI